jgi:hypothetical protein
VTPLEDGCNTSFKYGEDGDIKGTNEASKTTIEKLRLNHKELKKIRKEAVEEFLDKLSKAYPDSPEKTAKIKSKVKELDRNWKSEKPPELPHMAFVITEVLRCKFNF